MKGRKLYQKITKNYLGHFPSFKMEVDTFELSRFFFRFVCFYQNFRFNENYWNLKMVLNGKRWKTKVKSTNGETLENVAVPQQHLSCFWKWVLQVCFLSCFPAQEECLSFSEFTSNWCVLRAHLLQNVANSLLSS